MNRLSLIVNRQARSRRQDTIFVALLGVVTILSAAVVNTAACVGLLHLG